MLAAIALCTVASAQPAASARPATTTASTTTASTTTASTTTASTTTASTTTASTATATRGAAEAARAAEGAGGAKPSDAPLPSCLDQTLAGQLGAELKPRGVQKKDFLKRRKVNLVMHGGLYGGDLTSSSWLAGGSLGFFFTEDFGIAGEFDVTPLTLDLDSPLAQFFNDNRFEPGLAYVALGNLFWAPIHAKLKMGGGIVHADIMLFAGGGRMIHEAVQGVALNAGFAIDMFATNFMSIRLSVRDLMAVQEVAAETRFTNNLIATAGISIWIPTGL